MLNQIMAVHGVPTPPTPAPVAGYRAWYDASDTATITVSGTAVTQWNDKSANAYNLTQSTAAYRPLSGTRTLNSKNVIDFDGSNDCLVNTTFSNWAFLNNSTGSSIFIVLYSDASATNGWLMSTTESASANVGIDVTRLNDDKVRVYVRNTTSGDGAVGSVDQGVLADNAAVYYTMLLTPNNATTANRAISRVNGGAEIKNNTFTLTPSNSNPTEPFVLGDYTEGGGVGFNGAIAEILLYPSVLNATDRAANETYLKNKWGL